MKEILKNREIGSADLEGIIRLVAVLKIKKKINIADQITGKFGEIGKKMAKEGKTSVDLLKEAREEMYGS